MALMTTQTGDARNGEAETTEEEQVKNLEQHDNQSPTWPGRRRHILSACVVAAAGFAPTLAGAVAYSCIGQVGQVAVAPNGEVNASFNFNGGAMAWQAVCNVSVTASGVDAPTCKGLLALLITARSTGQSVQVWFDNATPGQCSGPAWRPLREMGWYWGPSMAP
jgi:hypothetical protein